MSTEEAVMLFECAEAILASVNKVSSRNRMAYSIGSDHYENDPGLQMWGLKEPYELAAYVKRKLGDRVAAEYDKRKSVANRKFMATVGSNRRGMNSDAANEIRGLENAEV